MAKTVKIRIGGSKAQLKSDLKKFEKEVTRNLEKQIQREVNKLK
ncbi:hypothetical protein MHH52_20675 [Paenibacillus sp. FSL K6-0276]|nr:hypothetical protein [Paenibacillus sp.]